MTGPEIRAQLEQHHEDAFGWALSCCAWERALAEDVLQTSYLKVLAGRAAFGGRSSFKSWLFGVIRRTAAEERRRRAFRTIVSLEALKAPLPSARCDPEEELAASEETARLVAALRALPRRQREVLHLVFYDDLSIREAAETLGIPLGTARTHYQRGKARLGALLAMERDRR